MPIDEPVSKAGRRCFRHASEAVTAELDVICELSAFGDPVYRAPGRSAERAGLKPGSVADPARCRISAALARARMGGCRARRRRGWPPRPGWGTAAPAHGPTPHQSGREPPNPARQYGCTRPCARAGSCLRSTSAPPPSFADRIAIPAPRVWRRYAQTRVRPTIQAYFGSTVGSSKPQRAVIPPLTCKSGTPTPQPLLIKRFASSGYAIRDANLLINARRPGSGLGFQEVVVGFGAPAQV